MVKFILTLNLVHKYYKFLIRFKKNCPSLIQFWNC
jgi:hypothetical protein